MIDLDKTYQTASGLKVRDLKLDGDDLYPVTGRYGVEDPSPFWLEGTWTEDGMFRRSTPSHPFNLVEDPYQVEEDNV